MAKRPFKRIVVKVGSNVLTQADGLLNTHRIENLVSQISALKLELLEVLIVTSGAVASGRSSFRFKEKLDTVSTRQVLSALGQVKLINAYSRLFENKGLQVAQVLVTREDFRTRTHYLNMQHCLQMLLGQGIIPIINENDVVSVTELMFTDNDELAGLIANMVDAEALVLLTNVDGVYRGEPGMSGSELIREVIPGKIRFDTILSSRKSDFGRGGMITKCNMAEKISNMGVHVYIANGNRDNILPDLLEERGLYTHFVPAGKVNKSIKKWIGNSSGFSKAQVWINEGAEQALRSNRATSLLPVGITQVNGIFSKGDLLEILNREQVVIGWGVARYGHEKAEARMGKHQEKPLIHYDYLYLNK